MARNSNQMKIHREKVYLSLEDVGLDGELCIPEGAHAIVLFVDGNTGSFFNRDRDFARVFNRNRLATLVFDLKTEEEILGTKTADVYPYVELLARRVADATWWLKENPDTMSLRIGYFGTAISGAAAIIAAAGLPTHVATVACYESRPDLAGTALAKVTAPTLLMVSDETDYLVKVNREAARELKCEHHLEIISASPAEEDEDKKKETIVLDKVSEKACKWFCWYLDR